MAQGKLHFPSVSSSILSALPYEDLLFWHLEIGGRIFRRRGERNGTSKCDRSPLESRQTVSTANIKY